MTKGEYESKSSKFLPQRATSESISVGFRPLCAETLMPLILDLEKARRR
jgi:hypothetical protein